MADGSRIVVVDGQTVLRKVQEGDRFAVDGLAPGASFRIVSVGFHRPCLEVDRPLPAGRYGWSIQQSRPAPQAARPQAADANMVSAALPAASRSPRRSAAVAGNTPAEQPKAEPVSCKEGTAGLAAGRALSDSRSSDGPWIVACGTPQAMPLELSLREQADAACWPSSRRRWHVTPAALTAETSSRWAGCVAEATNRCDPAERVETPGQRFDGRTRWWRFGPHDPYLCNEAQKAEGNEATFAFRLRRAVKVIRPETLMMARDQLSGESFRIRLLPMAGGTHATDPVGGFDLEVAPRSGEDALPVRWSVKCSAAPASARFLAVVTDRQGGVSLWVDGAWYGRQASTLGIRQHDELSIGDQLPGLRQQGLDGLLPTGLRDTAIDQVAVWSRPLVHLELLRAMEDSPLHATGDGSLQLCWSSAASPPAAWDDWRFRLNAADHWVLDASGTLRHGLRVTGLQAVQQAWEALLDNYQRGGQAVGIGAQDGGVSGGALEGGEVFRFDTSPPPCQTAQPAGSPPLPPPPAIARLGFCQIDESGPWLGLSAIDG